jgi:hypothetical protein
VTVTVAAALAAACAPARGDWLTDAAKQKVKAFDGTDAGKKSDEKVQRRGKVVIRRVKPQCKSDWDNDPTALPYLVYQLRERTEGKFPILADNEGLSLLSDEIFDFPLIYFTSHLPFTFTDEEVENVRKFLARGGTFLLDDCSGSGPFTDSVPPNVQRIVPGIEMKLMLRETKAYFDLFNIVYKMDGLPRLKEQYMQPFQCGYINGRPGILFTPNDYGCNWEVSSPPTPLNPLGSPAHAADSPTVQQGREDTYKISINWLFYALTH